MNTNIKSFIEDAKKYLKLKDYKKSLEYVESVYFLDKKNFEANLIGGYCLKELNLQNEAQECYDIAYAQKPNDPTLIKCILNKYSNV